MIKEESQYIGNKETHRQKKEIDLTCIGGVGVCAGVGLTGAPRDGHLYVSGDGGVGVCPGVCGRHPSDQLLENKQTECLLVLHSTYHNCNEICICSSQSAWLERKRPKGGFCAWLAQGARHVVGCSVNTCWLASEYLCVPSCVLVWEQRKSERLPALVSGEG